VFLRKISAFPLVDVRILWNCSAFLQRQLGFENTLLHTLIPYPFSHFPLVMGEGGVFEAL